MSDRTLIATGAIGAALAAICCATPLLAVLFGTLGLTAWLANADYVVMPALFICLVLVGLGLHRRRAAAKACCDPGSSKHDASS
jgi:mercuric ion transport protein